MKLLLLVALVALVSVASALPITHRARALVEAGAQDNNVCHNQGGVCQDVRVQGCTHGSGYQTGLCPGDNNWKCCPARSVTHTVVPTTAGTACTAVGGECLHSGTNSCSGNDAWRVGLCPGPAEIKCCAPARAHAPVTPPSPTPSRGPISFERLRNCYPQGEAEEVKQRIGGAVNGDWITNTCAIRMSHTLNCAGKKVPQSGGESIRGKNNDNYIFRVKQLGPLMRKNFGAGFTVHAPTGRGVPLSSFQGKRGIIMFDTTGAWDDATGHFDLWDGQQMVENSHANSATTQRYFGLSVAITLWEF